MHFQNFTVILLLDGVDYGFVFGDMKLSFMLSVCTSEMFSNALLFNDKMISQLRKNRQKKGDSVKL